jgi:cobalt-zinc-cadmium efflux system membrane fusion protein
MIASHRLYTGAAVALVAAAALGFGAARLTQPSAPAPIPVETAAPAKPADTLAITPKTIASSQIKVAPAANGELDATILGSATVEATPDAEAVLTARAPGTVSRIFVQLGDAVRAGQTLALVESRDASQIAADRSAAAARVTLAAKQLARERTLLDQGVSPRADFESAQANLAVAQADARRASAAAGAARVAADGRSVAIVSPVAGRVTAAAANLGQFVAAETELFRVADPRRIQITVSVPPTDAARVRQGDRVDLIAGDGRTIGGRVRAATGVVDPQSRTATVVVTPAAGTGAVAPGQSIQARIFASGDAIRQEVIVPQDAVQTLGDRTVVFVRTASGFKARTIRIASRSGGMVAIADGLAAGTPIATANAFLIKAELEKNEGGDE